MKKKTTNWIFLIMILGVGMILFSTCKKSDDNNTNNDPSPITVSDIDGNVYHTVIIGNQTWMLENLRTTKYNDGTSIPLVTDSTEWKNLTTPGYCWYNNEGATFKNEYGGLYNWYSVKTGKLAPSGWHVATMDDWYTLFIYLGGSPVVGGKMKETGTLHWTSPNTGASNSSGFTALPGGCRLTNGIFDYIGKNGYWWSTTDITIGQGWSWGLAYNRVESSWTGAYFKTGGLSVRCLKD